MKKHEKPGGRVVRLVVFVEVLVAVHNTGEGDRGVGARWFVGLRSLLNLFWLALQYKPRTLKINSSLHTKGRS